MRWKLGPNTLDLARGEIRGPDGTHTLTPREVALLRYLVERPGQIVSYATLLREVWGYAPRVSSRAPYHTIARIRRHLEVDPSEPSVLRSVRGQGVLLELPEAEPPTRTTRPLPRARSRFFGRELEQERIVSWLADPTCPLVTVTGLGGVGKTRLVVEILRSRPPDGRRVLFCPLTNSDGAGAAGRAVARALDLQVRTDASARVAEALAQRGPILLVLDNAEHLIDTGLPQEVARWLEVAPDVQVLATSHGPLELQGEAQVALGPLAVPDDDEALDVITASPSVQLLADRIERRLHTFSVTADNARFLAQCARRLSGWPLALELAAAQIGPAGLEELLAHLDQVAAAETRAIDVPDRHRSLNATLRWSWGLLSQELRLALLRLCHARAGFERRAAARIAGVTAHDLAGLAASGWVRYDDEPEGRYFMLEPVRTWLVGLATDPSTHDGFVTWAADLCYDIVMVPATGKGNARALRLRRERHNLEAALELALEDRDVARVAALGVGLGTVGSFFGPQDVALAQVRRALELADHEPMLWQRAGRLAGNVEDADVAADCFERAVALADDHGLPPHAYAECICHLAMVCSRRGELDRANELFERATALAPENSRIELAVLGTWSGHLALLGDPRGVEMGERAAELCRLLEDTTVLPSVLANVARAHLALGDPAAALTTVDRALGVIGDGAHAHRGALIWLRGLALADADPVEARRTLERAKRIASETGDQRTAQLASEELVRLGAT